MGDHDQLYVQPDVIPIYKGLLKFAKAITPNQFEAEYAPPPSPLSPSESPDEWANGE